MILHLDMDAFFAAVEQLENPYLRGKPVIIGGSDRGVVATASYEARVFGIHSAMPIAQAKKLCPHGIFLHGRHHHYSEISRNIIQTLKTFSPIIQKASIDEAYLDLSGMDAVYADPVQAGRQIKAAIAMATGGLSCSLGIAPVKFLAKICSDMDKPDGLYFLPPEKVDAFLLTLPIGKLPGVGKRMREILYSFGIHTVADLRRLSRAFLVERFGKWGTVLHERAYGLDSRTVHENPPAKSEGSEHTFSKDTQNMEELNAALLYHADRVGSALRKNNIAGRTITLKLKYSNFEQLTRSRTLNQRTSQTGQIHAIARQLLNSIELKRPVRLIGISVSHFEERPEQLMLPGIEHNYMPCPATGEISEKIDKVLDGIRQRFGKTSIGLASIPCIRPSSHHFEKNPEKKGDL